MNQSPERHEILPKPYGWRPYPPAIHDVRMHAARVRPGAFSGRHVRLGAPWRARGPSAVAMADEVVWLRPGMGDGVERRFGEGDYERWRVVDWLDGDEVCPVGLDGEVLVPGLSWRSGDPPAADVARHAIRSGHEDGGLWMFRFPDGRELRLRLQLPSPLDDPPHGLGCTCIGRVADADVVSASRATGALECVQVAWKGWAWVSALNCECAPLTEGGEPSAWPTDTDGPIPVPAADLFVISGAQLRALRDLADRHGALADFRALGLDVKRLRGEP